MRVDHYHEVLQHEEEIWDFVQGKVSIKCHTKRAPAHFYPYAPKVSVVIRTTLDVIDRITSKS